LLGNYIFPFVIEKMAQKILTYKVGFSQLLSGLGYGEWNYLNLLERGIAPANLCQRDTFCVFEKDSQGS
jgi:hypothetical protein